MIETRVRELLEELGGGNPFHEPVTLVAATKTRSAEEIARALGAGAFAAGENRVQEFREKAPLLPEARWHFIGRLQTNKVKYLVGKCGQKPSGASRRFSSKSTQAAKRARAAIP